MSYTYKTKGDHARALLLEGTSARDAAKTTGMAEGTINLYFYKLKSKGDVDGTPGKPKPTAQSEKALKYLRIEKKVDVNQAKELQETAKDILSRLGNLPQKEAEAPAPVAKEDASLAETIKETAGLVLDQLDDLKKEKATEPTPAPAAPKADPKTPAFKKAPYTAPLGLKPLEVEAKKQTGLHDTTVKQVIRLLRGGGIPSGVATLANAPVEQIELIHQLLIDNDFIRSDKKGHVAQERKLYTKPIIGLMTSQQLSIEKRLMAKSQPQRISVDLKLDIKYIHRVERELIELGLIAPTLEDVYGADTIREAKKMLSQKRSTAVDANLMQLPVDIVKELEEERTKTVANSNPIGQARKLFLEGKNAIAIASELPLSYEAVVDVFKGLLRENLVAGTAASPLKPESLETKAAPIQALAAIPMHDKKQIAKMAEGAAKGEVNLFAHLIPKAETKEEPQFVEEPFNDVHGVTHQQIALAAEAEEKTLDQAVEEGLIPGEIDVVEDKTLSEAVEEQLIPGEVDVVAEKSLDEAIEEGLIPDTIEAVGDNEATLNHLAEQSSELTPLGEAVMDTLEQIRAQSDDEVDAVRYLDAWDGKSLDIHLQLADAPLAEQAKKPLHFSNEEEAKAQASHDQSGVEPWKVHDNIVRFEGDNWRRTLGLQLKADAEQAKLEKMEDLLEKGKEMLRAFNWFMNEEQIAHFSTDKRLLVRLATFDAPVREVQDMVRDYENAKKETAEQAPQESKKKDVTIEFGTHKFTLDPNGIAFEATPAFTPKWNELFGEQLKDARPLIQTAEQEKEKERLAKELDAIFDHTTPHYGDKDGDLVMNNGMMEKAKADAMTEEQTQRYAQACEGESILKSYMGYLTQDQYRNLWKDRDFCYELAKSIAPMFDVLHKVSGTTPEEDVFAYYEYIAGRAIDAGDAPEFIAETMNIPLAIVLLMKEFKGLTLQDITFKPHETAEEFVLRISRLKYTKSQHTKNGKMAFTGEGVSSASEEEPTPISIPTKMSFGKKAVSVAVVRKHVEKMLQMMELSGNELIDASISFSGGQHDEVE